MKYHRFSKHRGECEIPVMNKPKAARDLCGHVMVQMGQAMYPWDLDKVYTNIQIHYVYYGSLVEVG